MDRIKQQQNRGYLIAGIGALVALLAFLLLPYANVTLTCSQISTSSNCSGVTNFSLPLNATLIAQATTTQSQNSGNLPPPNVIPFEGQGALWFLPILALAALALTWLLLYRDIPFGKGINAPAATQKKWGNYALIGIAALSVLAQIVLLSNLGTQFQNSYRSGTSLPFTVSAGAHGGFWLYLLGMAAVAGGAVLLLVQANKSALPLQGSYQLPSQPWQSPSNPYPQQNPTGQYPPPQNPYPTGQYPPASYPPQPPYPPGQ
jgi:hypothetical protein